MYEPTIIEVLTKDKKSKGSFLGVFARDEIPKNINYPACFVMNTENRNKPGQHWLAFYYDSKGTCYFFDSYGRSPDYYNFKTYIERTAKKCFFSDNRIQGHSYFCGYYCVFYLLFKARNQEKIFFSKLTKNLNKNDKYIATNIK